MKSAPFILPKNWLIKRRNKTGGFTLLELMISLTILAVIVVLVFGGLRVSVKAWEKGEQAIDRQQRYRTVLNLIRQQLTSIIEPENREQGSALKFTGDASFLQCISSVSLVPKQIGKVRVLYRVMPGDEDSKRLLFFEKAVYSMTQEDKNSDPDSVAEKDFYELLSGIYVLEFSYLASVSSEGGEASIFDGIDDALPWQPTWESKELPIAVRVRFKANEESAPVDMVIPVRKRQKDE